MSRRINCHCLAQVCSVLRSLFLRVGAVYGISNLTNGVDHHHGEVGVAFNCNRVHFLTQVENVAS